MRVSRICGRSAARWCFIIAAVCFLNLLPRAEAAERRFPRITTEAAEEASSALQFTAEDQRIRGVRAPEAKAANAVKSRMARFLIRETGKTEEAAQKNRELENEARRAQTLSDDEARREALKTDPDAYLIRVNRVMNTVTVYERDEKGEYSVPVRAMVCSTGRGTPLGSFSTSDKYEWHPLYGGVYGQYATRITGHILFHSVPYTRMRKDTLKYEEFNKLGTSASMGCIRMAVADVKWIYDYCASGTRVTIYDDEENAGPLGKPAVKPIDKDSRARGWDPTDPDPGNKWLT